MEPLKVESDVISAVASDINEGVVSISPGLGVVGSGIFVIFVSPSCAVFSPDVWPIVD